MSAPKIINDIITPKERGPNGAPLGIKIPTSESTTEPSSLFSKNNTHDAPLVADIVASSTNTPTYLGKKPAKLKPDIPDDQHNIDVIVHSQIPRPARLGPKKRFLPFDLKPFREAIIVTVFALISLQIVFLIYNGTAFKETLFKETLAGINELKQAKDTLSQADLSATLQHFFSAETAFTEARKSLEQINGGKNILPISLISTSDQLLSIGESISHAGKSMTEAAQTLIATTNFKLALPALQQVHNDLVDASKLLAALDISFVPASYQEQILQVRSELPTLKKALDFFAEMTPALLNFTADQNAKRYIIMLQNTTERRGTGGFMGSFIEATFQNGKLTTVSPKDVYTVDWQQFDRKEASPGLQPYMKRLALRDANYNPDFYQASQDINWAYEESRQGSVDGIIAIDESIVPMLLKATGPIYLPDFQVTLRPENYFTILQYYIENNKDDPETPKRILLSFINEISKKVNDPQILLKLWQALPDMIAEKHIQMAMFDPELQTVVEKYGLDGTLLTPEANLDYLHINAINVGGNKGDRLLKRTYSHEARIKEDGTVEVTIKGTWQNLWGDAEETQINALFPQLSKLTRKMRDNFWYVIGRANTKHVVRLFVPKGSTLIANSGFAYSLKPSEENDYLVWYSEVNVPKGGSTDFSFTYTLPYTLNLTVGDNYRFLMQKQAGAENETLTHTVKLDTSIEPLASYPEKANGTSNTSTTIDLNTDRYFEMLVRRK